MKDLIAFYKTSTAQKFIKLAPQITAEMLQRITQLMDPELNRLIMDAFAEEQNRFKPKQN